MPIFRFIALLSSLTIAAPAFGQNTHISRLYEQVLENIEIAGEGYRLDSYGINRMNAGETAHVALDLPTGVPVKIMGDCDEDCMDLDLGVFIPEGKLLGEDRAADYYPIVEFESGSVSRVDIELDLAHCDATYCYVAYSIFIQDN